MKTSIVIDVYGRKHKVDKSYLDNINKTLIPLVNKFGVRVCDSASYRSGMCSMIHRENIKEVLP